MFSTSPRWVMHKCRHKQFIVLHFWKQEIKHSSILIIIWSVTKISSLLHRLEQVDEILRSARLSGYLHIRTVLTTPSISRFNKSKYYVDLVAVNGFLKPFLFLAEMEAAARRTSSYWWYRCRWLASTLCRSPWNMHLFLYGLYRYIHFLLLFRDIKSIFGEWF